MLHKAEIRVVEAAELDEIIGEVYATGEQPFVAGNARVHGIAYAVNDPGVGQDQPEEADKSEVEGHFISDVGRRRRMHPQRLQIASAELPQFLTRKGAGPARKGTATD